jgi:RimJ/RimL family protein N-acetyltransferase
VRTLEVFGSFARGKAGHWETNSQRGQTDYRHWLRNYRRFLKILVRVYNPPSTPLSDGVVTLRLPAAEDVARLAYYGSDEALLEGIWVSGGGPRAVDPFVWAAERLEEYKAGWTPKGGIHGGALVIDAAPPFVGLVYFRPVAPGVVELSYGIAPPYRGRCIATRAIRLAAGWALDEGGFSRVELRIPESHLASRRVAEKAGFKFERHFETFIEATGVSAMDLLYARSNY